MANTPSKKTTTKTPVKKAAAKKTSTTASAAPRKKAIAKTTSAKAAPKKAAAKKTAIKKVAAKKVGGSKKATVAEKKPAVVMTEGMLLAMTAAQGMYEKKAENIRILDLRKVQGASTDFFVISSASNDKQVEAIAKSAEEEVKKVLNQNPWHREGYENLEWILTDYIDVVAHVFQDEKRHFYDIEGLWGDATEIEFKGK